MGAFECLFEAWFSELIVLVTFGKVAAAIAANLVWCHCDVAALSVNRCFAVTLSRARSP